MKNNKAQWLLTLAISGVLLTACQHQIAKAPVATLDSAAIAAVNNAVIQKSPNDDRTYAALLLPNSLQVILVSDPTLENSAASLAVGVGSAQDPQNQLGLAHYLEHMLFLGTTKYPEPDGFMKYTQSNGGMTNAFTAFDRTNFLFQINATKYDEALDRFSDYFKEPTFDVNYADKERNAINNEWSLQKAQDAWNLQALDGITGNPQNPHSQFSIGNLETLVDKPNTKLNDDLKAFYNRYYSANTMRLTLVGKQSIPELKALAEKYFASIPNKNVTLPAVTVPGISDAQTAKDIYYKSIKDLKTLYVDFPMKSNKAQWRLKPNEYVLNLITSEEPGTLGEQMRKKGLATDVTAYVENEVYGSDGYLRVKVELTDAGLKNQDEIIASVFSYVDLVKQKGLNANYYRELQAMRAKDFQNTTKPNPLQQAVQLSMMQYDIPVANLLNEEFTYESYDEPSIKTVLDQLDTHKVRVWHISNQERADQEIPYFEGKYAVKDISAEEFSRWDNQKKSIAFNLPPLNNLFTDKPADIVENTYLKPHQVVSQPGVEAFVQQPEFYREDKGQLSVEINSTFSQTSAKNIVLSNVLNDVYKKQNLTLIDRAARASLGVNLAASGPNSQAIYLSGYTTKHSLLLDELLHSFVDLKITDQIFGEALVSYKQGLDNANKDQVFRQMQGQLARLTHKVQWKNEELLAAANKVTLKDVVAYHKAVLSNPLLRVLAVGNYSESDVKTMALAANKIIPGKRLPEARTLTHFITPKKGQKVDYKESLNLADSAVLQAWFRDSISDDEQASLAVLNALFGNAFFMQLRTNEQLGYVVTSGPYPVDDVPGFVMLVQSSNADVQKIKARMDKFRTEYLATLWSTNPADIERVKQSILANVTQKPTNFYQEAGRYAGEFWNAKYKFDSRDRFIASLNKVNLDSIVRLYQDMLLNNQTGQVLIQMRGTNFKDSPFAQP